MDKLNCGLFIFIETKAKEPDLFHQLERVDDEPAAVDVCARPRTGRGLGPVAAVHPLLGGLVKDVMGTGDPWGIIDAVESRRSAGRWLPRRGRSSSLPSRSGLRWAGSFEPQTRETRQLNCTFEREKL